MTKKYLAAAGAASLAVAAFQIFLLVYCFDREINMYAKDSVLPLIFYTAVAAAGALFLFPALIFGKSGSPAVFHSLRTPDCISSWLCGIAAVATAIARLAMLNDRRYLGGTAAIARLLGLLSVFLGIAAAFHFILLGIKKAPYKNITAGTAFFPVLWAAAMLMCDYFDFSLAIRSPLRILGQLSFIAIMVFFLFELRTLLNIGKSAGYTAAALITVLFVNATALPVLLLTAVGYMEIGYSTVFCFAQLVCGIYAASRLYSLSRKTDIKK